MASRYGYLDRVGGLSTDLGQPLLEGGCDLPQVSGLPDKQGTIRQAGKEVGVMGPKVGKEVLVGGQLEVFAAEFHRDHFFITQGGRKAPLPQRVGVFDYLVVLTDQTVDSDDKLISIHWGPPAANSWCDDRYSTERLLNGSAA